MVKVIATWRITRLTRDVPDRLLGWQLTARQQLDMHLPRTAAHFVVSHSGQSVSLPW